VYVVPCFTERYVLTDPWLQLLFRSQMVSFLPRWSRARASVNFLGSTGRDCKYRHALPPGFVLKSEKKAAEEAAKREVISLEDFLETEASNAEFAFHVEIFRTDDLVCFSASQT
jgi:hypothetical protein